MAPVAMPAAPPRITPSKRGDPTWEMADFFPRQGEWTEDEYLALDTNRLVELADGRLEVLPMPTYVHQLIVAFLYDALKAFVAAGRSGRVLFAPLPVKLRRERFREPDIVYLSQRRAERTKDYPEGADLVMEVVSEGRENRDRDELLKRREYAEASIAEYWIVDPEQRRIVVLTLRGKSYREASVCGPGQTASSVLLPGFSIAVDAVFAVAGTAAATAP